MAGYPGYFFVDELLTWYPNARVIVMIYEEGAWYKSIQPELECRVADKLLELWFKTPKDASNTSKSPPPLPPREAAARAIVAEDSNRLDDLYELRRNQFNVESLLKSHKTPAPLYFIVGLHGWDRLCGHLRLPIPRVDFPVVDEIAPFKQHLEEYEFGPDGFGWYNRGEEIPDPWYIVSRNWPWR